ncbi:LuxR C-terminal-related transcriptional regulator [Nannocystaceae bacterium ST9]
MSSESILSTLTAANGPRNNHEVRIWVERDDDANRISAVLEALGYTVLRELEEGDGPSRLRWAVNRLSRRHKLTLREQDILERVLAGRNNDEIGRDLEISRATVKWHMHNVFAKTNTGNRESLLRLALQLGGVRDASELEALAGDDRVLSGPIEVVDEVPPPAPTPVVAIPAADVPSKPWF